MSSYSNNKINHTPLPLDTSKLYKSSASPKNPRKADIYA